MTKRSYNAKTEKERKYRNKSPELFTDNKLVICACGCGEEMWLLDNHLRERKFIGGHNSKVRRLSPEHKLKISFTLGEKRGWITPINTLIRNSIKYSNWRKAVFERDDYTCQMCGKSGIKLHADHIKSFAFHKELRFDISNGRTLCVECHKTTPNFSYKAIILEKGSEKQNF